ncbi:MAG: acyltransferase [Desulfobacterales bacterium]|nr:acyltransferase [Desulfobacterales bacterium]
MEERRYDIDWVRVVATLAVFIFHSGRFFDKLDWHLKNVQQNLFFTMFVGFLDLWMMPLLFLLSGLGTWHSLKSRSSKQYLLERVKRLLIPLYTVGAFILLPPQFYFELVTHGRDVSSIWKLIPPLYGGSLRFSFDAPYIVNLWSGHLWFLQFLFIASLLLLPLLLYLKSEPGQHLLLKLADWSDRWGVIFLFLIPLVLVRIGLRGFFHGAHTWADLIYYSVFFLIGYVIASDRRFTEGYKRHGWVFLVLGIAAYAGEGFLIFGVHYPYPGAESFSWMYVLFNILISIGNFCWVMFILSLAAKYMNFNHKVLTYGNEAVLPFYIFHQTIILCVGWFVIRWNIGILPKYLIIALVSFALIMTIYDLLVRRFNAVRFFFGMRSKKKPSTIPDKQPAKTST